ncbi:hypothetical protein RCL1_000847 [Eukaryota sp. TZLM3-RCL]
MKLLFVLAIVLALTFATVEVPSVDDNDFGCSTCVFIVGALEAKIDDSTTREQITDMVLEACKPLPSFMRPWCDSMLREYTPLLIDLLLERYDAKSICQEIHACKKQMTVADNDILCPACQFVIGWIESKISEESTRQEIIAIVEQVCNFVPASLQPTCKLLVEQYGNLIIDLLVERFPGTAVCQMIGLCPANQESNDSIPCSICTWVVGTVYSKISDEATKEEIISIVSGVCAFVPASVKPLCTEMITNYGNMIIDLVVQKFPPSVVCSSIGLCAEYTVDNEILCPTCKFVVGLLEGMITDETTQQEIIQMVEKVCDLVPAAIQPMCKGLIEEYAQPMIQMLIERYPSEVVCQMIGMCPQSNDIFCPACQFVIGWIESKISEESTRQEIIAMVEQVCNFVPASLQPTCKTLIEQYGNLIIDLLVERFPGTAVCQMIGLCPANQESNDSIPCSICTWVVGTVYSKISDEATKEEIISIVSGVCAFVPASVKPLCTEMITNYGNMIIDLVVQKFPASVVCSSIGLCPAQTIDESNDTKCSVCTFVVGLIQSEISSGDTREEIRRKVLGVCKKVPSYLKYPCEIFISSYTDKLVDMFLQKYPADRICRELGQCKSKLSLVQEEVKADIPCSLCEFVAGYILTQIDDPTNREEIRRVLSTTCAKLPTYVTMACVHLVDTYTESLIDMIVNKYTAHEVCASLGLCGQSSTVNHFGLRHRGGRHF